MRGWPIGEAERRYRLSLEAAWQTGDRLKTCYELQGMAMAAAGSGAAERALRLASAAEANIRSLGVEHIPPFWAALVDRHVATPRAALDEDAADAAWAVGAALLLRQAVDEALGPVVLPSAPTPTVTFREVTDANRAEVVAIRVAPGQERFVNSVADAMEEAVAWARAKPWYRAVYAGDEPIGFVMLSWDVEPQPPDIIGPWFLWKLIVDERHQDRGHGRQIVGMVVELIRAEGATELLTSHVIGEGSPAGFYAKLGFVPTGALDPNGEVILSLDLTD